MKKIILIAFLLSQSILFAKVNAVVSILPQVTFLEAIGGDKVNVSLMVTPGNSPHTYEPKPSQMKDIAKADVYFTIGADFEETWMPRFANQNKNMIIFDLTKNITIIAMKKHHHDEHEAEHHEVNHDKEAHDDHEGGKDPHIWTSPKNVAIMAKDMYNQLVLLDAKNAKYYKSNLESFLTNIHNTDLEIKNILKDTPKDTKFLIFHPAWGYFAHEYNLVQVPIEVEGKNPKPKALTYIIEEAREENVKAIFTAPEFSDKIAKSLANELKIPVIQISPLNKNWSKNLITFAKAIANK